MADTQNERALGDLAQAIRHLKDGGVVAIPTDTLYGLAADVFNPAALDRVFAAKGRSESLALPVLVNGWAQVRLLAQDLLPQAEVLASKFWPGALTLVVRKANGLPDRLTAGGPTVAVRMPDHPVPIQLIDGLGGPITGTSANVSGGPDPSTLEKLTAQMDGRVDYVVNTGPAPKGIASTVVDITGEQPRLLREGSIPFSLVLEAWDTASD